MRSMCSISLISVGATVLALTAGLASCGSDSDIAGPIVGSQPIVESYSEPTWGPEDIILAGTAPYDTAGNPILSLSGYWSVRPDGSEKHPYLVGPEWIPSSSAVWSPDGRWLALDVNYTDIYKMSWNKETLLPLSIRENKQVSPTWSPDGQWIAYTIGDGPDHERGLWRVREDGSEDRQFQKPPLDERCFDCGGLDRWAVSMPHWSPQGSEIVYVTTTHNRGNISLAIYDTTSARVRLLHTSDKNVRLPKFSSDGQKIVFQTDPTVRDRSQVWIINRDGSGLRRLADRGMSPTWSTDSRQIVYVSFSHDALDDPGNGMLWVMNADGSEKRQITFKSGQ